jgi:hypothetical protein
LAIYHFNAQIISRSDGRSSVAAAAYRAGEELTDERTGIIHDYTKRSMEIECEILAPSNSPDWIHEREKLWNEVENVEVRKDAQLAREINIALPVELSKEQNRELIKDYVKENFVDSGMVADLSIHWDKENPHAHVMLTTREVSEDGFGKKNREWNNKDLLESWREGWARSANQALAQANVQESISHKTLKEQGIDREPQIHLGSAVIAMEIRGMETERGDIYRQIEEANNNKMLKLIDKQIDLLEKQKEVLEYGRERSNGGNEQVVGDRDRNITAEKIIFHRAAEPEGGKREDSLSGIRDDKSFKVAKEYGASQRGREEEFGRQDTGIGRSLESISGQVYQDTRGIEAGHERAEGDEYREIGKEPEKYSGADGEKRKDEQGVAKLHDGDGKRDRALDKNTSADMDRTGEAIRDTICDNNRDNGSVGRDMEGDFTLDDIVKSLGDSIKKYEDNEKLEELKKGEQIKKEIEKGMDKSVSKGKNKGRDDGWELELDMDRDRGR